MAVSGSAAPFRLSLGSVSLDVAYSGSCPLNGFVFSVTGSVGGNFVPAADGVESYVEFIDESGLATPFGAGWTNGVIGLVPVAGGELNLS